MFTACGIMHRRCCLLVTRMRSQASSIVGVLYHKLQTQSSAPGDGRNYRPKHVELIEIINRIIIDASSWLFTLLCQYYFH